MREVVIGIDLGTSAVKVIMMDRQGNVIAQQSKSYSLIEERDGFVEQNPEDWVEQTKQALQQLVLANDNIRVSGISFSGQMHGLVMLNEQGDPIRNAILWNDTRTTEQCHRIRKAFGERLMSITKNDVLEGFTLPKLLWVKEHEPEKFKQLHTFLLPKDYLRYCLTGVLAMEPTDAAGTLLFDLASQTWSEEICLKFDIPFSACPKIIRADDFSGTLLQEYAEEFPQKEAIPVFAGGADNACGALGAGIVNSTNALVSIGTSGVVLSPTESKNYIGNYVHNFSYFQPSSQYIMGVTLAAGESLRWYRSTFAENLDFNVLLKDLESVGIGANGLLFTPYFFGERTPFGDSKIRASFIGMKNTHKKEHFTRAVIEGITFSLRQCFDLIKEQNPMINQVTCIGGATKNSNWLQIIADVFNVPVVKLKEEQGPALGAAMLAAIGVGWFGSYEAAVEKCVEIAEIFEPIEKNHILYQKYFDCYVEIYENTKAINAKLFQITEVG